MTPIKPSLASTRNLGELCRFTQGIQIPESSCSKELKENFIRYIYIRDLFTDQFPVHVEDKYPEKVLSPEDIVMINTGATSGFVYRGKPGVLCNNAFKISIIDSGLHQEYLWQYLIGPQKEHDTKRLFNVGGQPHVGHKNIAKLKIWVPPLPEQKAIADLLSTWDEAIEKTERLIQAKETRFKWLLRELITEPRKTQKDAKWKKVRISSFLTESRIPGTNGRDAKKITVKLYGKGVVSKDEKRIGSKTTKYYVRKAGQFIYSKLDFLNGAFGIIPEELDGFESTLDLPAFDISDSISKEWFLYYLIRPEYYTKQLGLAKGQRKARRVNPSEFLESKISVPPLEEQKVIAETLSTARQEIDLLKQLAEKYKTQKRGLMQKMLTGEWRVKPEIVNTFAGGDS